MKFQIVKMVELRLIDFYIKDRKKWFVDRKTEKNGLLDR